MSTWFEIVITALLGGFGLYLSWVSHKKGKAELFHKLFTEFNSRYAKLNNGLYELYKSEEDTDLTDTSKFLALKEQSYNLVIAYLNLCAEEFMWKNKKYIDKYAWKSWHKGIMWWYNNSEIIRDIWDEENVKVESYYVHKGKTFIDSSVLVEESNFMK